MTTGTKQYDLVAIGTGSASGASVSRAREAGWSVAVIDSRPFGGTCALRGCHPKKMLVSGAEAIDAIERMSGSGLEVGSHTIDWPTLMRFKRTETDPTPKFVEDSYAEQGIDTYHGRARFTGPHLISVNSEILEAKHAVIAVGAEPARLPIEGFEHLTTSTEFLELEELPRRIIFVGGGFISFEFAHVASRAGAHVTILHRGERPLEQFEPELTDLLIQATRKLGIAIELDTSVKTITKTGTGYRVSVEQSGKIQTFNGDLVVHGAGRVPEIRNLNLESANIAYNKQGITVNEYLQSTTNSAVYAGGDAVSDVAAPLTPRAARDGEAIAENLLNGNRIKPEYIGLASAVFSVPPLALVGLTEAEAKNQGYMYRVNYADTSKWFSSRLRNEAFSGHKIVIEEKSNKILGAHLFGAHSEELINIFAVAITLGIPANDLKKVLYAYPTRGSDIPFML